MLHKILKTRLVVRSSAEGGEFKALKLSLWIIVALKSQEKLKKRIMFICCSVFVPQLISRRRVWRSSGGTVWTRLSRYRGNDELGTDGEENVTVTEFVLHQLLLVLLWSQHRSYPVVLLCYMQLFSFTVRCSICLFCMWISQNCLISVTLDGLVLDTMWILTFTWNKSLRVLFFFPSQQTCHWLMSLCVVVISYYQVVKMVLWEDFKSTSLHVVLYLNTISTW